MKLSIFLLPILFFYSQGAKIEKEPYSCNYITDYYPFIYDGLIEYERGEYEKSFIFFNEAFSNCEPKNTVTYYELDKMSEVCARLKDFINADKYIRTACLKGRKLVYILEDSVFQAFFRSEIGKKLITDSSLIRKEYLSNLNLTLRNELIKMKADDQLYRQSGHQFYLDNTQKANVIDSLNSQRLITIFDSIGYPNEQIIGNHSIDGKHVSLNIILLHTKDSVRMNYFVPKILQFVKNGDCEPELLGNIIDQYYLYNSQPQIYGTYSGQNTEYAEMIDRDSVNLNRLSIGLSTLEQKEELDSLLKTNYPWLYNFE